MWTIVFVFVLFVFVFVFAWCGMVPRCFGDAREARLGGLEAGHGAHVVEAVEDLVVEHQLRLVLRVGQVVPHVRTLPTQAHPVKITPLKNIGPHLWPCEDRDKHYKKKKRWLKDTVFKVRLLPSEWHGNPGYFLHRDKQLEPLRGNTPYPLSNLGRCLCHNMVCMLGVIRVLPV